MDVNITINVGEEGNVDIKKDPVIKKRKLKNGKEAILKMPPTQDPLETKPILDMMGL